MQEQDLEIYSLSGDGLLTIPEYKGKTQEVRYNYNSDFTAIPTFTVHANNRYYTPNMQAIVQQYNSYSLKPDNTTIVLFLCTGSTAGVNYGFMQVKSSYGFLYLNKLSTAKLFYYTAAHEAGHGAYRLWTPLASKTNTTFRKAPPPTSWTTPTPTAPNSTNTSGTTYTTPKLCGSPAGRTRKRGRRFLMM